jgi:hypothetical protein
LPRRPETPVPDEVTTYDASAGHASEHVYDDDSALDKFVAHFKYEPPDAQTEMTMKGDSPRAETESEDPVLTQSRPISDSEPIPHQHEEQPAPSGTEDHVSWLDFNRAVVLETGSRPSPMLEPSVLDRSGVTATNDDNKIAASSGKRWQVWPALGVLLVFAVLGLLGWRSRVLQSKNGPLAILETHIKGMRHQQEETAAPNRARAGAPEHSPDTAAPSASPPAAMQQSRTADLRGKSVMGQSDQQVTTRKFGRGEYEMMKANSASNPALAVVWLQKAMANGNPDAPVLLANRYLTGDGVPRSCDRAMTLLQSAAAKPNVRARNKLAGLYAIGACVPRDRVLAYRWLRLALAADPNNRWARQNRDLTWRQMTAGEQTAAQKYR